MTRTGEASETATLVATFFMVAAAAVAVEGDR
jgi:hypothetical protein